jgi:hypothetical protein
MTCDESMLPKKRLGMEAVRWKTPIATDAAKAPTESLARQVRWPTPTGKDSVASGAAGYETANRHAGTTLTDAAVRKTTSSGPLPPLTQTDGERESHPVVLNPRFVEDLMGLPIGWTDFGVSGTALFRSWRRGHSALLRCVTDGE